MSARVDKAARQVTWIALRNRAAEKLRAATQRWWCERGSLKLSITTISGGSLIPIKRPTAVSHCSRVRGLDGGMGCQKRWRNRLDTGCKSWLASESAVEFLYWRYIQVSKPCVREARETVVLIRTRSCPEPGATMLLLCYQGEVWLKKINGLRPLPSQLLQDLRAKTTGEQESITNTRTIPPAVVL